MIEIHKIMIRYYKKTHTLLYKQNLIFKLVTFNILINWVYKKKNCRDTPCATLTNDILFENISQIYGCHRNKECLHNIEHSHAKSTSTHGLAYCGLLRTTALFIRYLRKAKVL